MKAVTLFAMSFLVGFLLVMLTGWGPNNPALWAFLAAYVLTLTGLEIDWRKAPFWFGYKGYSLIQPDKITQGWVRDLKKLDEFFPCPGRGEELLIYNKKGLEERWIANEGRWSKSSPVTFL